MGEGNAAEYESLKALEIEEFYRVLDIWSEQKKRQIKQLERA